MNQNQILVHLYQLWPSNNRFCCKGYFMTGPKDDNLQNTLTWLAIIIVGGPFIFYINPMIWIHLNPALPIVSYILYFSCITFLALTQFSDPGIIPRKEIIQKMKNDSLYTYIPSQEDMMNFEIRICVTCQIKKPDRSNHCALCDNCVEVFDHHCPFVNNCIGKRNYAYFISFILTLTITGIAFGSEFLCFIIDVAISDENVQQILIIVLMIPFGICICLVFCLLVFHIFLIIKGKTTKEQLKNIVTQEFQNKCGRPKSLFQNRLIVEIDSKEQIRNDILSERPIDVIVPI